MRRSVGLIAMVMLAVSIRTDVDAGEAGNEKPALTLKARCAHPFRDNAVLQQKIPLPVWGSTLPEAKVTVTFDGQAKSGIADKAGKWRVVLEPMRAVKLKSVNDCPEGKTMTVECEKGGKKAVTEIKNVVVGEVWVCAGQSNMAGRMKRAGHPKNYPPNSVNDAKYPALRLLTASQEKWFVCSPETAVCFSRVAFFFARRTQRDVLVPMGVIVAAVGGSNIESWLNQKPYQTGGNYSRLMVPVVGYGIRGAIWYQGESNQRDHRRYQPKLESLIKGWRKAWQQADSKAEDGPSKDFAVHFVQLPGIGHSTLRNPAGGDGRAEIRQAYFEALRVKNTGMAVTIDVGAPGEHPPNKYDTGVRLARSVLQKVYGHKITACPLYKGHKVEGETIRISFTDDAKVGLMIAKKEGFLPPEPTPDAKLQWLAVLGKDGTWHWADGRIDGADLVVSHKDVKEPKAVRYAYTGHPCGNLLYNTDGMPVGPFSTIGYGPGSQKAGAPKKKGGKVK